MATAPTTTQTVQRDATLLARYAGVISKDVPEKDRKALRKARKARRLASRVRRAERAASLKQTQRSATKASDARQAAPKAEAAKPATKAAGRKAKAKTSRKVKRAAPSDVHVAALKANGGKVTKVPAGKRTIGRVEMKARVRGDHVEAAPPQDPETMTDDELLAELTNGDADSLADMAEDALIPGGEDANEDDSGEGE